MTGMRGKTTEERFWEKVDTTDSEGCWPWLAGTNKGGYGWFRVNGESVLAHRLAWEMDRGPIPTGMTVDHLCFLRSCCKTEHMEIVSRGENSRRGSVRFNKTGRGGPSLGCLECGRAIPEDRAGRMRCSRLCDKIAHRRNGLNRNRLNQGSADETRSA